MSDLNPNPVLAAGRGVLIAFEGIDGAGKSTQAILARDALISRGHEAVYFREPTDDGEYGKQLRALFTDASKPRPTPEEEFRLFLLDRSDDVQRNIAPALARGAVVLVDRYYISSMAYQGALGLDPECIRAENEKIAPQPALTLLFRLPVDESLARIKASRPGGPNQFERRAYQKRVHAIFESLDLPGLIRIDATHPMPETHQAVMRAILPLVS